MVKIGAQTYAVPKLKFQNKFLNLNILNLNIDSTPFICYTPSPSTFWSLGGAPFHLDALGVQR